MKPEEMAALHAAAFENSRPWSAQEFASLLQSAATFHVGDARAFALGRVIADEAELLTLATSPGARRRGLGKACVSAFLHAAHARGATTAFLEVAADNTAALALYRACGFDENGRRPGYYARKGAAPVDAILMRRALP